MNKNRRTHEPTTQIPPAPTTIPNKQISMCRAAFHTGYVPHGILRLSKSQLDGACLDARFDQVVGLFILFYFILSY
jgi:hypothetical protein